LEDGKIIPKVILKVREGGVTLDSLIYCRNQRQAVLDIIINHWVP
jgi:hypothetical protein